MIDTRSYLMYLNPEGSHPLDLRTFPNDSDWVYMSKNIVSDPLRPRVNDVGAVRCGRSDDNLSEIREWFASNGPLTIPFVCLEKTGGLAKIYQCFAEFVGDNAQTDFDAAKLKWTGKWTQTFSNTEKIYNFDVGWVNELPEDEYIEFTKRT